MSEHKKVWQTVGALALVGLAYNLVKSAHKKTETKLYSDEALNDIQDPKKSRKLEDAIDQYHESGNWDSSIFEV
jgi:hypothetical protein